MRRGGRGRHPHRVDRIAVTARFPPEHAEQVRTLLEAGPPYDLAEAGIDRHAVYLSAHEAVFVFEGPEIEWEVEDLADSFFHPELQAALSGWRELLAEEPHIGRPVFVWERGVDGATLPARAPARVGELMDRDYVRVAPEDTLGEAVERIAAHGVAAPALVVDYGRLIGVLGAHDVLRAVADRVHPSDGRAREWMSDVAATITPDASPDEAAATMIEHGLHHLPVAEREHAVGLVSLHAVLAARQTARDTTG
jgi:CBS domain-containing protein